jgi:GWxTD domain-containing protein
VPPFLVGLLGLALALIPRHQVWLEEEVHFIVSSKEWERFQEPQSDEDRDRFIEIFWRNRDRSLETVSRSARKTHELRLAESDRLFGSGRRRGRFTERGRLHQLLGPPRFRESFQHVSRLVAVELWHYAGVAEPFLPESFYLVLFRPTAASDFRIWNPVGDGVGALVASPEPGRFFLEPGLEEITRVDPELGMAVRSLVLGDDSSQQALSLLASLEAFSDLADRHRSDLERVRSTSSFRRLGGALDLRVVPDDAGVSEIHYTLELSPRDTASLAWEVIEQRHRTSVTLVGRLVTEAGERERWADRIELDVSARERDGLSKTPLRFQGRRLLDASDRRFELTLVSGDGASVVLTESLSSLPPSRATSGTVRIVERIRTTEEVARYRRARGLAFARRGERDRAIDELSAVSDLTPEEVDVHLELAALLFAESRHADLVAHLEPLLERFSEEPDVFLWLAAASEALLNWEEAVRFYERAAELVPESPQIRARLEEAGRHAP